MGSSAEMEKRAKTRVLTARMDVAEQRRIAALIKAAGTSQDQFLQDAVYEKLARGGIERTDVGILRDLDVDDRALVEEIADILRGHPDDANLREAIILHRRILHLLVK